MQGRRSEAMAGYEAVLAARERVLGSSHPNTVATRRAPQRLGEGKTTRAYHLA